MSITIRDDRNFRSLTGIGTILIDVTATLDKAIFFLGGTFSKMRSAA